MGRVHDVSIPAGDIRLRRVIPQFILIGCALLVLRGTAGAESPKEPYRIPRISGDIVIDGTLDEAAWRDALNIPLDTEVMPGENIPAVVGTDACIAYDSERIYIGFHCHDPEPSEIQAHHCERDAIADEDMVVVMFDTFNDEQGAYEFMCNPLGIQMDFIERPYFTEWDGVWDSAGQLVDDGYIVEIAIPFSSIELQHVSGEQTWGFALVRKYPRDIERQLTHIQYDRNNECKFCQIDKLIGFAGISSGNTE